MKTRKRIFCLVEISVPIRMSAPNARREVKELISNQCNWSADPGDIKCIAVESGARFDRKAGR